MEVLIKMLNVSAWILAIICPIIVGLKIWLECEYGNSLDKSLDGMRGISRNYLSGLPRLFLVGAISIIYLMCK